LISQLTVKQESVRSIKLKTADGVEIVGDYFSGVTDRGVLLLHMMPETRESWDEFALMLQEHGYHVLTIDLRGHGESEKGPDGYKRFSDQDHQSSRLDVDAAVDFLTASGAKHVFLIGASIGANLALQHLCSHTEIPAAVLFSPGLDYKGIETLPLVKKLNPRQAAFFVGSRDDIRKDGWSNAEMVEELYKNCSGECDIKIFDDAGHGITILKRYPSFAEEIMEWLEGR